MSSLPRAVRAFFLAVLVLASLFSATSAEAQTNTLVVDSQPGDTIGGGGGLQPAITPSTATFSAIRTYDNLIEVTVAGNQSDTWRLTFGAPQRSIFPAGTYANARWPSLSQRLPFLRITRGAHGCTVAEGHFVVHEVFYNFSSGTIQRFAADFEYRCNNATATLFGAIRHNSTIATTTPFGGNYPRYDLTVTPTAGGQIAGGPGILCGEGGSACSATFGTVTAVTLSATPSAGYTFIGWTGACAGHDETALIDVIGVRTCGATFEPAGPGIPHTRALFDSQGGDPMGLGIKALYFPDNSVWTRSIGDDGLLLTILGDDDTNWSIRLRPPQGTTLQAGEYTGARELYDYSWGPKLEVRTMNRYCSDATGAFIIHELTYGPSGTIQTLAVDFEQFCDNAASALYGAIRFNSTFEELRPFGGLYPTPTLTVAASAGGRVTGPGIDCGGGNTLCTTTVTAGTSVALTATADSGFVFAGWAGDCAGGPSVTIQVRGIASCRATFEPLVSSGDRTILWLHSEPGDQAGQGQITAISGASSFWFGSGSSSSVSLVVHTTDGNWTLGFGAASNEPLAVGTYLDAANFVFGQGRPSLSVRKNFNSCSATGRFIIHEIEWGASNQLMRFAADFEQHCNDAAPALFGAVRFNSTISEIRPFGNVFPTYELTVSSSPLGRVTGSGIDCGAGAAACTVVFSAATQVTLTAAPEPGAAFVGWDGSCFGLESTTVHVNGPKRCAPQFVPISPAEPRTLFLFDSQTGDYIGAGQRAFYSSVTDAISATLQGNAVVVRVTGRDGAWWGAEFIGASGSRLQPGAYSNAQRYPFATVAPGFNISGSGRGCNELLGRFVVHEVSYGPNDTLISFAADYEQHCENGDAALYGVVRFNSSVPGVLAFGGAYPTFRLDVVPSPNGRVTGTGIDCGSGQNTCTISYGSPTSVTLATVPAPGFIFGGWADECRGAETGTVRVNGVKRCTPLFTPAAPASPRLALVLDSDPGDYVGQGKRWLYVTGNVRMVPAVENGGNSVRFSVDGSDGTDWWLTFSAVSGQILSAGSYLNATGSSSSSAPRILVSGNGRACGTGPQQFIVREIVVANNTLARAAIDFEARCNGATAKLRGSLRYTSALPIAAMGEHAIPILVGQAARPSNGGQMIRTQDRGNAYAAATSLRLPWPTYNETMGGELHPAFGDVDGDGRNEVVLGLGKGSNGWIAVLDDEANGYQLLQWLRVDWPWYNGANGAVYPAVGDLDGDGYAEIVAGLGFGAQGFLEVFGGSNRAYAHQRWLQVSFSSWRALNGETHPAVGDLNGDGQAEIVVGLGAGSSGWIEVFHDASEQHRHKQWLQIGWPLFTSSRSGVTWPSIGDIDGNGGPEIVVGLGAGGEGYLQVFSVGASILPRDWLQVPWPEFNVQACGETRPAIGRVGAAGPAVVVGLGKCSAVAAGWVAIIETGVTGRPVIWRNGADAVFQRSGGGTFPAVIPR